MARSKSSQRWLKEHFSDPFVKRAQAEGMRSRAAYKLEELMARDRLLKPGMTVVDLGAAPGGWSQWVRQELDRLDPQRPGRVIALDILEMPSLARVEFLHGDFREDAVLSALETALGGQPVDLVLSDMAPNKSGMDTVDQPRAMYLAELDGALEHHELVKVKIAAGDREARDVIVAELADRSGAALVQRIGNVAVLYRPSTDKRQIVLPRP